MNTLVAEKKLILKKVENHWHKVITQVFNYFFLTVIKYKFGNVTVKVIKYFFAEVIVTVIKYYFSQVTVLVFSYNFSVLCNSLIIVRFRSCTSDSRRQVFCLPSLRNRLGSPDLKRGREEKGIPLTLQTSQSGS